MIRLPARRPMMRAYRLYVRGLNRSIHRHGRLDCFSPPTTRRYSLWYVLYSSLVGTVHVLVCSTTHYHYHRRITEKKKKKKGKKEAERCFRFLASCPLSAEFIETWMHERFGVCGWYCTALLSVHICAYSCSVVTMPSLHICTLCMYLLSIHQVSIPSCMI